MSLLDQDTIKKEQVSKEVLQLDAGNKNNKEYKVEAIRDSAVYANKLESDYLPGLYSQTKVIRGAVVAVREKDCLDAANMTLGMSTSASNDYHYPG